MEALSEGAFGHWGASKRNHDQPHPHLLKPLLIGGGVLWDVDYWIYPAISLFRPDFAAGVLRYRHARLDMARSKAKGLGYEGAMFPCQSAASGAEVAAADGKVETLGTNEIHFSGDIAATARQPLVLILTRP